MSNQAGRDSGGASAPEFSPRHRFSAWPNADLPAVAAGVYVVWEGDTLIYAGMSGREFEKAVAAAKVRVGLITRLRSHASGRLSGDQFCVYVANRLVIPSLDPGMLSEFASGDMTLDKLTKTYIHERLEYQFAVVDSSAAARALEKECRSGSRFGTKPLLNPLRPQASVTFPLDNWSCPSAGTIWLISFSPGLPQHSEQSRPARIPTR